jgi:transcriptional regulator with XRE-family HTH domain
MAGALTKFGILCRTLRNKNNFTMGDQARALQCEVHEISAIESGRVAPSEEYVQDFRNWLGADDTDHYLLLKRGKSNVVGFNPTFSTKNNSTSMRLFRKVSKLDANQIRAFRKKIEIQPEPEND